MWRGITCWIKRCLNYLIILTAVFLIQLFQPSVISSVMPLEFKVTFLENKVRILEDCQLQLIRLGYHRDLEGRWWK